MTTTIIEPTKQRLRHSRITRAEQQIADSAGEIGLPFHAESLLARLERRGSITAGERQAGEEFQRLFRLAALDPLRAADMGRIHVAGGQATHNHGSECARRQIDAALDALGGINSPCGSCAWFVLGCEMSLREWTARLCANGRRIRKETVGGYLLGGLAILAKHFRT